MLIIQRVSGLSMTHMHTIHIGIHSIILGLDLDGVWASVDSMAVLGLALVDIMEAFIIHFLAGVSIILFGVDTPGVGVMVMVADIMDMEAIMEDKITLDGWVQMQ